MLLWLGYAGLAQAQPVSAQQTPAQADNAVEITFGQSSVPLYGPWKFTVGDSPVDPITHAPLWAEPEFDDSNWETVDLTPRSNAIDPWNGLPGYVPGWSARGHAGYWGYAWYRVELHLKDGLGEKLALAEAPEVDSVYQVFADGRLVGGFGTSPAACQSLTTRSPCCSHCRNRLPAAQVRSHWFWPSEYGWGPSP
jgi:hypothetical protein